MATHARLAPSSSKRWMRCTASPSQEAEAADRGSRYSDRGDKLHKLSCRILTKGEFINGDTWHFPKRIEKELAALPPVDRDSVMDYVNLVAQREGVKFYEIQTEWMKPHSGGTSDAVVITPVEGFLGHDLEIIDAKFGLGVREYAKENTQLMIYAFGVMDHFGPAYGPFRNVTLTVAQTGLEEGISSWSMTPVAVEKWETLIRARVDQIAAGDVEFNPHPSHHICGWCKAKNTCPGRTSMAQDAARGEFQIGKDKKEKEELTWAEKLEMAGQLAAIAKDWQAEAKRLMLAGEIEIPGLVVVEGKRSRDWTAEGKKAAKRLLEKWGFDETQMYSEPVFASPSQADALVNVNKETKAERKVELSACYEWSNGPPTITEESRVGKKTIIRKTDLARRDFAKNLETEEGPED